MEDDSVDFERSLWKAVRSSFKGARHLGCHFHWSQAVLRHLRSDVGLAKAYGYNNIRKIVNSVVYCFRCLLSLLAKYRDVLSMYGAKWGCVEHMMNSCAVCLNM